MGDPGKAKSFAESALRLDPVSPEALHLQAQALSASGKDERALSIVEKAIPLSSNPLPLLLQRAHLLNKSEGLEANLAGHSDKGCPGKTGYALRGDFPVAQMRGDENDPVGVGEILYSLHFLNGMRLC